MNPLTQNNVDGVGLRFNHWENLVKEKIGEVQKLERKAPVAAEVAVSPVQPAVAVESSTPAESVPDDPPSADN